MNLQVVQMDHVPKEARPGLFLKTLAILGIAFLVLFSAVYLFSLVYFW